MRIADLRLRGAGGEPVDFARTIVSHGVAELPPNTIDLPGRTFKTTLAVPGGARTVRISSEGDALAVETLKGGADKRLAEIVVHMFRLDEDLSGFYVAIRDDEQLSWCASGAGRMLRAPTVFEDVVKTD
jgi:3-methyladenine DNA glycosylase/8-oxoguanine DNA glycosylase